VHDRAADVWFCTAEHEVPFYKGPSKSERVGRFCKAGTKITGRKNGNWIVDKDSGAYLPYKCPDTGKWLFKNERVMIFDKSQSFGEGAGLQSFYSTSTMDSTDSGKMQRQVSVSSVQSVKSVTTQLSTAEVEQQSFWICCANQGVPHFSDPNPDAAETSGTLCLPGTKINAVKQGNWLKLIEKKESVDVLGTMIGRRSMKVSRQTSYTESGSFLPLFCPVTGKRLFKNEKVDAWEKAKTAKSANELLSDSSGELGAKKQSCAVM